MSYVTFVVGTLPEIVKSIDVARHLSRGGCKVVIYDTMQNRSHAFEAPSGVKVVRSSVARSAHTDDLLWVQHCAAEIAEFSDGLVVVQGDTYSALAGAHGAISAGMQLAHIEAGMRSHNPLSPFPEEMNRVFIDTYANLLFCATQTDFDDLASGINISAKQVFVVGNTVCDPIFSHAEHLKRSSAIPDGIFVSLHRRENRQHHAAIMDSLARLVDAFPQTEFTLLKRGLLAQADAAQFGPNASMMGVCDHLEFLELLAGSAMAICDSGGILEESVTLGVPVICLRRTLERGRFVPGVDCLDPAELAGGRLETLVAQTMKTRTVRRGTLRKTFGDGQSAQRIAAIIQDNLQGRIPQGAQRLTQPADIHLPKPTVAMLEPAAFSGQRLCKN